MFEGFYTTPLHFIFEEITKRLNNYEINGRRYKLTPEFKTYETFSRVFQELPVELAMKSLVPKQSIQYDTATVSKECL